MPRHKKPASEARLRAMDCQLSRVNADDEETLFELEGRARHGLRPGDFARLILFRYAREFRKPAEGAGFDCPDNHSVSEYKASE